MSCEVLTEKEVITKKDHVCIACGRIFPAGTKMIYQVNILDGYFGSVYKCSTCEKLLVIASDQLNDGDGCFYDGCVEEAVWNAGLETPEEWLNALTGRKE